MIDLAAFPTPGVRGVLIQGRNGGWGDDSGSSRGLTGPADFQWMLCNRAAADAVLVSAKTSQRENYRRITIRPEYADRRASLGLSASPALVVATRTAADAQWALDVADYVVTCASTGITDSRVIVAGDSDIDWGEALRLIRELGLIRIVCEGGPTLIAALIRAQVLDELSLTTSPVAAASITVDASLTGFIETQQHRALFTSDDFRFEMIGTLPTWTERLNANELYVLRQHGTEPAFSVDYEKKPAAGYYVCRACGSRLFDASDQFDARCGWPAFWQPSSSDQVRLIEDTSYGMRRVEVRCKACDSHLGHVFHGEGFGFPTDDRYCINAICLERRY